MRKSSLIVSSLLLLVVLVASLDAAKVSNNWKQKGKCLEKHSFFEKIFGEEGAKSKVFVRPVVEINTKCGEEWALHKTCCKIADIEEVAKADADRIRTQGKELINSVEQLGLVVSRFVTRWSQLKKLKEQTDLEAIYPKFDTFLITKIGTLRNTIQQIRKNSFESKITNCTEAIIRLRNNALCPLCSGRSETFFIPGNKRVLITEQICKSYLESCVDPLTITSNLFLYLRDIATLQLRKTRSSVNPSNPAWALLVRNIRTQLSTYKSNSFIKTLNDYLSSELDNNSAEADALCFELITVAGPTWIDATLFNFKELTDAFNSFMTLLGQTTQTEIELTDNSLAAQRKLQDVPVGPIDPTPQALQTKPSDLTSPALNLFEIKGDVLIVDGGIFNSRVDVVEQLPHNTITPLPIDLSKQFP